MKKVIVLTFGFSIFLLGCFASNRYSKPRSELDDFRGVKWGAELSTLGDMQRVEQDKSSNNDIVWYTRKGEILTFGQAKLENIFYSFWMGSFESVWIDFKGEENFEALKKELFERFGKVLESGEIMKKTEKEALVERSTMRQGEGEFYLWDGKRTEMWLSYSKSRHKGTLSINSRRMSEERRAYEKQKEKEERSREKRF